jgi:membrane protease YdiL (CAAX protease family)
MLIERLRLPDTDPISGPETDREAAIVLLVATFSLLVFAYWGRPGWFNNSGLVDWVSRNIGGPFVDFPGVGGYVWWGITSFVARLLIPAAIIVWLLKRRPVEFGFRIRGIASHIPMYLVMYLVMLPVLIWASSFASFQGFYPFYDRAGEGGAAFWLYELGYLTQFIGLEAFFRGFLTFGLLRRFGMLSVVVMTVPYTMIHFGKPMPEATAAIFAGLILGYMALRSRSFVPGIFLHAGVAITMDLLVLWRNGFLGNIF